MGPAAGVLDAPTLRRAMALYAEALRQHRDEINSLNVFPVPDGDTGTNLLLTQEAVERALADLDGEAQTVGALGQAVAEASLLGARGNSGVILSQVLRGLFERLPAEGPVGAGDLANALRHASEEANRAVARPAEGTVLTVLRDAAAAAEAAARDGSSSDPAGVVDAVLDRARASLDRTRDTLPALRDAGVVDAGGKGLVLLFDALHAALRNQGLSEPVGPPGPVGRTANVAVPSTHRWEVQYLLEAEDDAVPSLRRDLQSLGDSVVVVGGGGLFNVHVHTDDPDGAVKAGEAAGTPREVHRADLATQIGACLGGQARAVQVAEQLTGLVAVADGSGLVDTFRSLGAVVVQGGPGRNPAVGELLEAVEAIPSEAVVIVPNHANVMPAAERAAAAAGKRAHVVRAPSIPAGLAAAAAFNPLISLGDNAAAMDAAAATGRSGEVAQAERDADTQIGPVSRGDWVGMTEGRVAARAARPSDAVAELVRTLGGEGTELITLIVGAETAEGDVAAAREAIQEALPNAEVEVLAGGQPRFAFLIGVE